MSAANDDGCSAELSLQWGEVRSEVCPTAQQLLSWAQAALQDKTAGASIRVTDKREMHECNLRWRNGDYATNVLSFPADLPVELGLSHLGDILICADVVNEECIRQGKSRDAHWAHMVVHGMLHLQGYDHQTDEEAATMEALEIRILAAMNIANPYEPVIAGIDN